MKLTLKILIINCLITVNFMYTDALAIKTEHQNCKMPSNIEQLTQLHRVPIADSIVYRNIVQIQNLQDYNNGLHLDYYLYGNFDVKEHRYMLYEVDSEFYSSIYLSETTKGKPYPKTLIIGAMTNSYPKPSIGFRFENNILKVYCTQAANCEFRIITSNEYNLEQGINHIEAENETQDTQFILDLLFSKEIPSDPEAFTYIFDWIDGKTNSSSIKYKGLLHLKEKDYKIIQIEDNIKHVTQLYLFDADECLKKDSFLKIYDSTPTKEVFSDLDGDNLTIIQFSEHDNMWFNPEEFSIDLSKGIHVLK